MKAMKNMKSERQPKRLIAKMSLMGNRLAKGTRFTDFVDVGDPVSQTKIMDAQGIDEIVIVDANAERGTRTIAPDLVARMAKVCHVPLTAGGGVASVADARALLAAGADKVIVTDAAFANERLVAELVDALGADAVCVALDVRKEENTYVPYAQNSTKRIDGDLFTWAERFTQAGARQMIVTSIDRDGTLSGFDFELYAACRDRVEADVVAAGGAGSYDDIVALFASSACVGCCIGKMLSLRDYDIVRIKAYLHGKGVSVRDA